MLTSKNIHNVTYEIGGKLYHLFCDIDSPLDHVKESLFKFVGHVANIEAAAQAKASAASEKLKEEPPVEEKNG